MALIPQEIRAWSRIRLDREPADLDPDDLVYAMNVDLFLEPGTIRGRRGKASLYGPALGTDAVRRLARVAGIRYQVAGQSLFRDSASILSTLSPSLRTTIQASRPLNDTTTYAFIADTAGMYRDDGKTLYNWGIVAPTGTPVVGTTGTGLTGTYSARYTYCRKVGTTLIAESNPSPVSASQTLSNQNLTVGVVASTDSQVTGIRVYRTVDTGSTYLFDQDVANTTATITSSQADTALGAEVAIDNDPPQKCSFISAPLFDRYWLCGDPAFPHYLYYTKRFQPEAVPTGNYLILGTPDDPLQAFWPFGGVGMALTRQRKYRLIAVGSSTYVPYETPGKRGTLGPYASQAGEDGVYFAALDGIFRTTGFSGDEQLAGPILPLFNREAKNGYLPINLDHGDACSMAIWKGRLYFSYPDVEHIQPNMLAVHRLGTNQWQMYDWDMGSLFSEADTDYLLGGGLDGKVYRLEVGRDDDGLDISWKATTKDNAVIDPDSPGGVLGRKLHTFTKTDADCGSGVISEMTFVDGVLQTTMSLSGSRKPVLQRIPGSAQGFRWSKTWSYTGKETTLIYATTVLAGQF